MTGYRHLFFHHLWSHGKTKGNKNCNLPWSWKVEWLKKLLNTNADNVFPPIIHTLPFTEQIDFLNLKRNNLEVSFR
jgi:hypothetical protein